MFEVTGEGILRRRWRLHILNYGAAFRRELYELPKGFCNKEIARSSDRFCGYVYRLGKFKSNYKQVV